MHQPFGWLMALAATVVAPLALTIAASAQTTPAPQQYGAPGSGRGYGQRGGRHGGFDQLNLSEQQRQQIMQIMQASKQQNAPLYAQMQQLREQARSAQQSGDQAQLENVRQQMQALKPQLQQARQQTETQIASVLTPEQRAEYQRLREQKRQRGGQGGYGPGRGYGDGL